MATLSLRAIKADITAQPRVQIVTAKVAEYAEDMKRGDVFPPLIVFREKNKYWLADGFHRYHAAIVLDTESIECDVREGGLRDAMLYSCGANAAHGFRRTIDDKRRAVTRMLEDEEWEGWGDHEIAKHCNVSHPFVGEMRRQIFPTSNVTSKENKRIYSRGGTISEMDTRAIGRVKPPEGIAISEAVIDIRELWLSLPPPEDAAAVFPEFHRHVLRRDDLLAISVWFGEFAELWEEAPA
jgi:hypothetical protein